MFSNLTKEQKQRREALRDAGAILERNGTEPDFDSVVKMAMFILNDEVPARSKPSVSDGRKGFVI